MVNSALKLLQNAGYIEYEVDPDASARLMFLLGRSELYRLNELSPHEEAVITAILRNYGGLFTDYGYIDEALIAMQAGIGRESTYQVLKTLSRKHIVHFIPQRKTPYITYTQSRVDIDEMVIAKNVYEDRKEQFTKRIEAIIEYASNNNVCRSRQLLRYFGETKSHDCNVCDVCVSSRSDRTSDEGDKYARQAVIVLLEDGEKHMINELHQLNIPQKQLDNALRYLVNEEIIHLDGSLIYL